MGTEKVKKQTKLKTILADRGLTLKQLQQKIERNSV